MRDRARARDFLSPVEDGLLIVAAAMPDRIPTDNQSKTLLNLKSRFEMEGLAPRALPEA